MHDLHLIWKIKVDRYFLSENILLLEMHGFANASEKAEENPDRK